MRTKYLKWTLIFPAVFTLLGLALMPIGYSFYTSLCQIPKIPIPMPWRFIGLKNYVDALTDNNFTHSALVTFKFMGVAIPLQLGLGLILALALNRLGNIGRAITPILLSGSFIAAVSVGIMWYLMYSYQYGPISYVLDLLGLNRIDWLGNATWALMGIILANVWYRIPFVMILLYAGLIGLPKDVFEAARIDGASAWKTFTKITLPLLKPVIVVLLAIRITDSIKMFGMVKALTQGGPGNATEVITYYIYNQGFEWWNLSYAAALSFYALIIAVVIFLFYIKIVRGSSRMA